MARRACSGVVACVFLVAVLCLAQTGTGNIQGTVKDVTGAVVPAAKVTLLQTETNQTTTTQSNEVGFFLFPALRVGSYEVTVEQPGMAAWKTTVTLIQGQTADLLPLLKPGSSTTEVTVAGEMTPLVTTNAPTLATVVERERIDQLPLNGRNVTSLIYMTTPGVESDGLPRVYGLRYASEVVQAGRCTRTGTGPSSPTGSRDWTPSTNSAWRPTTPRPN